MSFLAQARQLSLRRESSSIAQDFTLSENCKRASNPIYPYRASRMGYRGVEEKILEQSETPSPSSATVDLDVLWVDARKNKTNRIYSLNDSLIWNGIINNCKLFLDISCTRAVGIGTVYNTQDAMIHNAQIPSNHLRVSIDISIEDDALLPIPVDEDTITVRGALGTFVAWPVSGEHSATSPLRIDEQASKKAKVVKSKPQSKSNLESSGEVAPKKTNFCAKLMNYVQKLHANSMIMISIPLPIYGFSTDEFIGINEVKDVNDHDWIGASVISLYIRYLYDNLIPKSKKKTPCQNNDKDCGNYVINFLKEVIKQGKVEVQFNLVISSTAKCFTFAMEFISATVLTQDFVVEGLSK
ncbi:hypothetical protein Lal_00042923 [Lupinus albus]|nr:hypothetical protein Lal_00042923 [Lupinus albus]